MSEFTRVGKSQQVGAGEMAAFEVGGQRVAVANVDGSFHAFGDICSHQQCSLSDGELDGKTVTCPCHGSQFDVTTGEVLNPPATEPVPVFRCRSRATRFGWRCDGGREHGSALAAGY